MSRPSPRTAPSFNSPSSTRSRRCNRRSPAAASGWWGRAGHGCCNSYDAVRSNHSSSPRMNLPNIITIGRILLVPLTIWLIVAGQFGLALLVFIIAGIGDGIDGFIARRYSMKTKLGAYLDPLADKLLL